MAGRKPTKDLPPSEQYKDFLYKINEVIKNKGYTQKEIAVGLGLTTSAVSKILSAQTKLSLELTFKLLNFLEINETLHSSEKNEMIFIASKNPNNSEVFVKSTKSNLSKTIEALGKGILLKDTVSGCFFFKGEEVAFFSGKEIDGNTLFI